MMFKLVTFAALAFVASAYPEDGTIIDATICEDVNPDTHFYIPDNDCEGFYQCFGGIYWGYTECPPGLLFNIENNVCDWPDNVTCNKKAKAGNCCAKHRGGLPFRTGCDADICENLVCSPVDQGGLGLPQCCDYKWDKTCARAARRNCNCGKGCMDITQKFTEIYTTEGQPLVFDLDVEPAQPGSDVMIKFTYEGDINNGAEFLTVKTAESTSTEVMEIVGDQPFTNTQCRTDTQTIYVSAFVFNEWQNDGIVSFEFLPTNGAGCDGVDTFCATNEGTIEIDYTACDY